LFPVLRLQNGGGLLHPALPKCPVFQRGKNEKKADIRRMNDSGPPFEL
jgi:hypothetical protein